MALHVGCGTQDVALRIYTGLTTNKNYVGIAQVPIERKRDGCGMRIRTTSKGDERASPPLTSALIRP